MWRGWWRENKVPFCPYMWILLFLVLSFVHTYGYVVGTSSGLVILMLGVPLFSLFLLYVSVFTYLSLFCCFVYCLFLFHLLGLCFHFSVTLCCFIFFSSVSVFTCFVCCLLFLLFWFILNLEKGFCCLCLMCCLIYRALGLCIHFSCLCLLFVYFSLFYSLFSFLLSPFQSSVFTFPVCPCCLVYCMSYFLFILSLLWEGGSRVGLTLQL